mmetsp:Transcript_14979/g.16678  ORF Transcript_14979/g.16678 Transcript_14979/m.16678 type:complete len:165 (-) Transcript_14979:320-814(-)
MTLQMERNVKNYEEMIIEYTQGGSVTTVTNLELSSCDSTEYELKLTNVTQVYIRAYMLSGTSSYYILVQQEGKDYSYPLAFTKNKTLVEYVAIILIICFMTLAATIAVFALFRYNTPCFRTRMQKYQRRMKKVEMRNAIFIQKVMNNMVSGTFEQLSAKPVSPS